MTLREILIDIHALGQELLEFEAKYGVRSETSMRPMREERSRRMTPGWLDFTEWASVYRTWLARQAQYRVELPHLQPNAPSLQGLIRVAS